ncbi:MAG: hypothetical protein KGJ23_15585 [Euryarchaeota archaeon]|nr:hypothetical protein [Euryarchaeota archaeon]MDE1838021.1 hypothetical protein [Euryarchaeota archaeon]MDE2045038.1 hypothetical protein [Thermoplasmata archaeon]
MKLVVPEPESAELSYRFPGVSLDSEDIQILWDAIWATLEPPPEGWKRTGINHSISGTWAEGESLNTPMVKDFLKSTLVGQILTSLRINLVGYYQPADGEPWALAYKRTVSVSVTRSEPVSINLSGEREWIASVKGSIDPLFTRKSRNVVVESIRFLAPRYFGPLVLATLVALLFTDWATALGLVALMALFAGMPVGFWYSETFYRNVVVLHGTPHLEPLYIRVAETIVLGLILALFAARLLFLVHL